MSLINFLRKKSALTTLSFDKAYCKIYYHSDIRAVHLDWNNRATHDQFIEACDFSLSLMVEKESEKNDRRQFKSKRGIGRKSILAYRKLVSESTGKRISVFGGHLAG